MVLKAPAGTEDLLPKEAAYWNTFVNHAREVFGRSGYRLIQTPTFELTELFVRGIGEATDVVSKEMFAAISGDNLQKLLDGGTLKSSSRFSLRPEGTAGVVRAAAQHDLVPQGANPAKLMYAGPMFRAERPQKGRLRQFHQVGVECLGAESPTIDAEAIIMLMEFYDLIGIPRQSLKLLINSMGCDQCRPAYRDLVKQYMQAHSDELCDTCRERMEINPLRAFDCKNPDCAAVMDGAPHITDHLCEPCETHYDEVKALLALTGLEYVEDFHLVRGLDYYTRTVFEVQAISGLGSQNAIGGGGRYDHLMAEIGGRPTPGFGFALGYERCVLALEDAGFTYPELRGLDAFVACVNNDVRLKAFELVHSLRTDGFDVDMDHQGRSLKGQFKLADKLNAARVIILGPDELEAGQCVLRDMGTHHEVRVGLDELATELGKFLL